MADLAYAAVEVDCKLVSALLDSGSFVNVISKELLERLCGCLPRLSPTHVSVSSVAAQPLEVLGSFKKKIHIGTFSWYVNFVVVTRVAVPLILGALFFQKTGLSLDFRARSFHFSFKPQVNFSFSPFSSCIKELGREGHLSYLEQNQVLGEAPEVGDTHDFEFEHLSSPQSNHLRTLVEEFDDVLTAELGQCTVTEYQIELIDTTPVRRPPYRLSPPKVHVLREKIQRMLQQGIIRPSTSNYSSPIFLVPKANGDFRPVIDYRYLNSKINIESVPLPDVHSAFAWFGGAKVFTSLDLNQAYYQIP